MSLKKWKAVPILLEYIQDKNYAWMRFKWPLPEEDTFKEALKIAKKSDVIVVAGGIGPMLEGEEMPVKVPGFSGGTGRASTCRMFRRNC